MSERKNILFITSDQQHWFTLGQQNKEVHTPNLDRLAAAGCTFNRAYTVNPTCTPTRASCITGTYPSQHGAYSLGTKLMEDQHVVGDDFAAAGYRTALIGKAHFQPLVSTEEYPSIESYPVMQDLDFWKNFNDRFYGFEDVELARNHTNEAHVGQHYALWMEEKGCTNWKDYFLAPTGNQEIIPNGRWEIPEEYHYDTWIAERTNEKIKSYAENNENFFVWASFFDPHPQYLVPAPWDTMYNPDELTVPALVPGEHDNNPPHFQKTQETNPDYSEFIEEEGNGCHGFHSHLHKQKNIAQDIATYYGMISLMDKYIGKILDNLDECGLTENTLVVFSTDHGHMYGHHGMCAKGAFHYDDLIRIPMIARFPGVIAENQQSSNLQSIVDMAPSFLAAADIPIPRCMTGKNMLPEWSGESKALRDHVIIENRHQPHTLHVKTYVNHSHKITVYWNQEYGELFDLENDPGEHNNLWNNADSQALKAELTQKLLFAEMGKEPLPMPRIAGA
ncbi:MAG: sulfatase-like hydrolase/transferase [Planctomycetes bacterium]|nr:sulfatase-like hydrolase/transferase [Planctomycetota bacterium]